MNQSKLILGRFATGTKISVDTKWEQRYTGYLVKIDKHMNVHLSDVLIAGVTRGREREGEECVQRKEVMIKGVGINCIKLEAEVIDDYHSQKESIIKEIGIPGNILSIIEEAKSSKKSKKLRKDFEEKLELSEFENLRSKSPDGHAPETLIKLEEKKQPQPFSLKRQIVELSEEIQSIDDGPLTSQKIASAEFKASLKQSLSGKQANVVQSLENTPQQEPLDIIRAVLNNDLTSPGDTTNRGGAVIGGSNASSMNLDDNKHRLSFTSTDILSQFSHQQERRAPRQRLGMKGAGRGIAAHPPVSCKQIWEDAISAGGVQEIIDRPPEVASSERNKSKYGSVFDYPDDQSNLLSERRYTCNAQIFGSGLAPAPKRRYGRGQR